MHFTAMLTRHNFHENEIGSPNRLAERKWNGKHNDERINAATGYALWLEKKWHRLNKDRVIDYCGLYGQGIAYGLQHFFDNKEIMLVKASKANLKYLRDFRPLQEFFIRFKNNTITMSNLLIKWNTARLVKQELHRCAFLYNFGTFNEEYGTYYHKLMNYVETNYREVKGSIDYNYFGLNPESYDGLISHLDNVAQFQKFVNDNPGSSDIGPLAMKMFGNPTLTNGMAVDPEIMTMLSDVLEFSQACGTLFNQMPVLTGYAAEVPTYTKGAVRVSIGLTEEVEMEIKQYMEFKGVLGYNTAATVEYIEEPVTELVDLN
jgi:hypothetical protein